MPTARKIMLLLALPVMFIALSSFTWRVVSRSQAASHLAAFDMVELQPGTFRFRPSGEFTRQGKPMNAPLVTATIHRQLAVMRYQVTSADYRRCVDAQACSMAEQEIVAADYPAVKVSWRDAHAYASWLSRETGVDFRLPTDEEWAFAAAGQFRDDALPKGLEDSDPGQRALTLYDRDASRDGPIDKTPHPTGSFGANENGLLDMAGNVWEWTDTCFTRNSLDLNGKVAATMVDCGVRVVEGRHRTYMTDFVRDARAGGCSGGTPPSNLGFRLVHDGDA